MPDHATYCISDSENENALFNLTLDHNDAIALSSISNLFIKGIDGKGRPDVSTCEKAAAHYKELGLNGHSRALINLGWLYQEGLAGLGLSSQIQRDICAATCYEKANCPSGMNNLGYLYSEGRAGLNLPTQRARDIKAAEYYRLAANENNASACSNLAWLYENGRAGIQLPNQEERNKEALKYYKKAASLGKFGALIQLGWIYVVDLAGIELSQRERNKDATRYFIRALEVANNSKEQANILSTLNILDELCRCEDLLLETKKEIAQVYVKFLSHPEPIKGQARTALKNVAEHSAHHPSIEYWARFLLPESQRRGVITKQMAFDPVSIFDCLLIDNSLDPMEKNIFFNKIPKPFYDQMSVDQQSKLEFRDYVLTDNNSSFFALFPHDLRKIQASLAMPGIKPNKPK